MPSNTVEPPALSSPVPTSPAPWVTHSSSEDLIAVVTGSFLAALGFFLLERADLVTGGTAGVALLAGHVLPGSFALLYLMLRAPFLVVGLVGKGPRFVGRSVLALLLVSAFSQLQPHVLGLGDVDPLYAAVSGNLLAGIGLLILFRHGASLGGFNVVALLCQDRLGWRAGYVQLGLDATVLLASLAVVPWRIVLLSALGAGLLNLVLVLNHRPGRYAGA